MSNYIVVVCEFKDMKKIQRRQGIQAILNRITEDYTYNFVSPFGLSDDFQMIGAFHTTKDLAKIILRLKNEFFPLKVICGIGIGSVNEDYTDGVAFDLARSALEDAKNLKRKKETALSDVMVRIYNDNGIKEMALNSIYKLLYIIESHWTNKQRSVIQTMIFEDATQAGVANMFDVSPSNVTQMLTNGHYFAHREALDNLEVLLKDALDGISE